MAKSSFAIQLVMEGQTFDTSFDPTPVDNIPQPVSTVYSLLDEARFYFMTGITDGEQGMESRILLIPADFQKDYASGYSDGAHFYKFLHFF